MCGERGSPGRCGWDEGREEGEKALEHALPSFRLLSLERVLVRHRARRKVAGTERASEDRSFHTAPRAPKRVTNSPHRHHGPGAHEQSPLARPSLQNSQKNPHLHA